MTKHKLTSELNGKHTNYIQPFIHVKHTDTYEQLKTRFQRLSDMGIYSLILQYESNMRQMNKFDDKWWGLLERVSAVCSELGMTYWMQDAAPFPTGAANGLFEDEEHKDKSKIYIIERHTNLKGPIKDASILVENFFNMIQGDITIELFNMVSDDELLYVIALQRQDDGTYDIDTAIDLTAQVKDGLLQFDLPEGDWRLSLLFRTRKGGRKHYMNLLDAESVGVQIDAVHKPHYENLKEELGKTWNGFFYDEPEIGNAKGYDFFCLPGSTVNNHPISLPWSDQTPELLESCFGSGFSSYLPCLWYDCGEITGIVRYNYMDIITRQVSKNYNGQVYEYCRDRGIKYIGHVLEDENSHARLGCGPGHFFRTEKHQDMAGIDIVSAQIIPGMDIDGISWYGCTEGDGEFYHYGLAKLASSEGHINPEKEGKSICEYMALYGSVATPKFVKFITDHLFVNGINNLIPTGIEVFDVDEAKLLFDYSNRVCRLMNDSEHVAPVAVLYHAEAEWAGDYQPFHKPAKVLATNQIDYDVIPCDCLTESEFYKSGVEDGKLKINKEYYQALVIPYCERIPKAIVEFIVGARGKGLPVYFVDVLPSGYCEELGEFDVGIGSCKVVELDELASALRDDDIYDIEVSSHEHFLRYNHFVKDGMHVYMLHNEEPSRDIETTVSFPTDLPVRVYNAMDNTLEIADVTYEDGKANIQVKLGQYESAFYVFSGEFAMESNETIEKNVDLTDLRVVVYPDSEHEHEVELDELCDLGTPDLYPRYGGKLIYKATFNIADEMPTTLDLGRVCDSAEVTLNRQNLGCRISSPYRFDISKAVKKGRNELIVEVATNPARAGVNDVRQKMLISVSAATFTALEPVGMLGPITVQF